MQKTDPDPDTQWELPLQQMLTYRLSRLNAKITAHAIRILKQNSKLSLMQWRLLVSVNAIEKATHSKIAANTQLDGGQLSRSIRSMIEIGLLQTTTHESDSRQQYLSMTPKGRAAYNEARPCMRKRQAELMGALTPEELTALFSTLDRLELTLEAGETAA